MPRRRIAMVFDNVLRPGTTGTYCLRALQKYADVEFFRPDQLERIPPTGFDFSLNIDDGFRYRLPEQLRPAPLPRSRKRSTTTGHKGTKTRPKTAAARETGIETRTPQPVGVITPDECHDHFKTTVATDNWKNMRGWHVLRDSFISACASRGVDQRLVETWAGHMSSEMSRRCSHL